jgi:hypothetical protein
MTPTHPGPARVCKEWGSKIEWLEVFYRFRGGKPIWSTHHQFLKNETIGKNVEFCLSFQFQNQNPQASSLRRHVTP